MSIHDRWRLYLDHRKDEGRLRTLTPPVGIDFSSNDYLGYSKRAWPHAPLAPWGRGAGGEGARSGTASRLLRGHHPIWDEVETKLAAWHRTEAALVFTSGYAANEGLLSTIIEPGDLVFSDQFNHASIIDGIRLSRAEKMIYPHNDPNALEDALRRPQAPRRRREARFIVTESLFGMEGDIAPLTDLADLAERHDAHLIVDEAHATGCFGTTGGGLVDALDLRQRVLATVHTGGKALAVPGAYVAGSRLLRETLVNRCRHFIFTTALPPQIGAWWLDAVKLASTDETSRVALRDRARLFRQAISERRLSAGGTGYIATILLGADDAAVIAARKLQDAGFDVRAIRPPTVADGTARLRVSIHADHEDWNVLGLIEAISRIAPHCP